MKAKKWLKVFVVLSFFGFLFVGGFNYIVDPYGLYNTNIISKPKIKQSEKMRLIKAIRIQEIKPKSICLGSSRTEYGYNPTHKYFIQPSYNLGISGSSVYENRLYLEHALEQGHLQKVLLVADYFQFNTTKQKQIKDIEVYFDNTNIYKYLFTIDTLKDSYITLVGSNEPTSVFLNNGQREHNHRWNTVLYEGGHLKMMNKSNKIYYKKYSSDYLYADTGQNSFSDFEYIVKLCYEYNIELDIIFGPSHIRQWEALNYYLGYDKWLKWKKDIVESVNKIATQYVKKPFRIFDFSVYHSLTAEKVPVDENSKMKYHWESSHYKNELGLIVLDRLVDNSEYRDFGIELNVKNIDSHLVKQTIKRQQYIDPTKYKLEIWGK